MSENELNLFKEKEESGNFFKEIVDYINELDKDDVISTLKDSLDQEGSNNFRVGGLLAKIQESGWWNEDYSSFKAYIEDQFGIHYRKAMYLIAIYNGLVQSDIPYEKVSHLGWSKIKELADIISVDNVDEWVEKANSMTVMALREEVKKAKQNGHTLPSTEVSEEANVSTFTVKVHNDQKRLLSVLSIRPRVTCVLPVMQLLLMGYV